MSGVPGPVGVLILQLGTPDDPSVPAVRRYLLEFLSDPRVIENRIVRSIMPTYVTLFRCRSSAVKYQRIWDPKTGMPLLHLSNLQVAGLQKALPPGYVVRLAMRYGKPAIRDVIQEFNAAGVERLVVLPMYPQYSATTTASALDGLFLALMEERRIPALTVVPPYYEHPAYLDAQAAVIREELARLPWTPDHYVLSFHGIPQSYAQRGDPYPRHVERTTRGLVERLGWPKGKWLRAYQSGFGRSPWLKPYTDVRLRELVKRGARRVFVVPPGFTTDCLETIDEIGLEFREVFEHAGGEVLHRCPCLNAHPQWIAAMKTLVLEAAGQEPLTAPDGRPERADRTARPAVPSA